MKISIRKKIGLFTLIVLPSLVILAACQAPPTPAVTQTPMPTLAFGTAVTLPYGKYTDISVADLKGMLDHKNFMLINVTTPYDGKLEGTDLLIPYDQIDKNVNQLPKDKNAMIDIVTIILGVTIGASTQATTFLTQSSALIFVLGATAFMFSTAGGILFAKFMNLFLSGDNKINPLIGAAGVAAVPESARVAQLEGLKADPENHLLMHAMAPNVAGVIGSAVAAGIMMSFLL